MNKQLLIFEKKVFVSSSDWKLYVDGAARGNPGPAGIGILLECCARPVVKDGYYLGEATNNQAEYSALIVGLLRAKPYVPHTAMMTIFSDSQLLVRQIQGIYRVKDQHLRILHDKAMKLLHGFSYKIVHIVREQNKIADALANHGIDERILIPDYIWTPELDKARSC
jgi:ribonuclease HI